MATRRNLKKSMPAAAVQVRHILTLGWIAFWLLLAFPLVVFADDCTDSGTCDVAPRNIDGATGIAAVAAMTGVAYSVVGGMKGGSSGSGPSGGLGDDDGGGPVALDDEDDGDGGDEGGSELEADDDGDTGVQGTQPSRRGDGLIGPDEFIIGDPIFTITVEPGGGKIPTGGDAPIKSWRDDPSVIADPIFPTDNLPLPPGSGAGGGNKFSGLDTTTGTGGEIPTGGDAPVKSWRDDPSVIADPIFPTDNLPLPTGSGAGGGSKFSGLDTTTGTGGEIPTGGDAPVKSWRDDPSVIADPIFPTDSLPQPSGLPNYGRDNILNQPLGEEPPPNYGRDNILNQPLGEEPPPNYGRDNILNQPLGEEPPPNYGRDNILNQPLGEEPPPNYGRDNILNQPLGEDAQSPKHGSPLPGTVDSKTGVETSDGDFPRTQERPGTGDPNAVQGSDAEDPNAQRPTYSEERERAMRDGMVDKADGQGAGQPTTGDAGHSDAPPQPPAPQRHLDPATGLWWVTGPDGRDHPESWMRGDDGNWHPPSNWSQDPATNTWWVQDDTGRRHPASWVQGDDGSWHAPQGQEGDLTSKAAIVGETNRYQTGLMNKDRRVADEVNDIENPIAWAAAKTGTELVDKFSRGTMSKVEQQDNLGTAQGWIDATGKGSVALGETLADVETMGGYSAVKGAADHIQKDGLGKGIQETVDDYVPRKELATVLDSSKPLEERLQAGLEGVSKGLSTTATIMGAAKVDVPLTGGGRAPTPLEVSQTPEVGGPSGRPLPETPLTSEPAPSGAREYGGSTETAPERYASGEEPHTAPDQTQKLPSGEPKYGTEPEAPTQRYEPGEQPHTGPDQTQKLPPGEPRYGIDTEAPTQRYEAGEGPHTGPDQTQKLPPGEPKYGIDPEAPTQRYEASEQPRGVHDGETQVVEGGAQREGGGGNADPELKGKWDHEGLKDFQKRGTDGLDFGDSGPAERTIPDDGSHNPLHEAQAKIEGAQRQAQEIAGLEERVPGGKEETVQKTYDQYREGIEQARQHLNDPDARAEMSPDDLRDLEHAAHPDNVKSLSDFHREAGLEPPTGPGGISEEAPTQRYEPGEGPHTGPDQTQKLPPGEPKYGIDPEAPTQRYEPGEGPHTGPDQTQKLPPGEPKYGIDPEAPTQKFESGEGPHTGPDQTQKLPPGEPKHGMDSEPPSQRYEPGEGPHTGPDQTQKLPPGEPKYGIDPEAPTQRFEPVEAQPERTHNPLHEAQAKIEGAQRQAQEIAGLEERVPGGKEDTVQKTYDQYREGIEQARQNLNDPAVRAEMSPDELRELEHATHPDNVKSLSDFHRDAGLEPPTGPGGISEEAPTQRYEPGEGPHTGPDQTQKLPPGEPKYSMEPETSRPQREASDGPAGDSDRAPARIRELTPEERAAWEKEVNDDHAKWKKEVSEAEARGEDPVEARLQSLKSKFLPREVEVPEGRSSPGPEPWELNPLARELTPAERAAQENAVNQDAKEWMKEWGVDAGQQPEPPAPHHGGDGDVSSHPNDGAIDPAQRVTETRVRGPLAPENSGGGPAPSASTSEATHAGTTASPEQPGTAPDNVHSQTLESGVDGNEYLRDLMSNYRPTQNKIYAETVNEMKDAMVKGTFEWEKCTEPIRLDGDIIVDGHHRLIAAEMAAAETGRPLRGAPDAIIPEGGVTDASAGNRVPRSWGGRDIGGIGVKDGAKPGSDIPRRIDDAAHMKELEDLKDMSGPDD